MWQGILKGVAYLTKDEKGRKILVTILVTFFVLIIIPVLFVVYILTSPITLLKEVIKDPKMLEIILEFKTEYQSIMPGSSSGTYGSGGANIVAVALGEDGDPSNNGGQKYWSWYGFAYRDEWCAMFVSWCANQCGYIDSGIIPKFAYVPTGAEWFQEKGLYQSRTSGYTPKAGDIIFVSWGGTGGYSHVGIVESCDGTYVNTIEGNTGDTPGYYKIRRNEFTINDPRITGYGTPQYPAGASSGDVDWFYRCVEAEAGGEPYDGKIAVAQCIIYSSQRKGETFEQVITSPGQYSCVSDGRINEVTVSADTKKAADEALAGKRVLPEKTEYFINYEAAAISWWHQTLNFMGKIGQHSFYAAW